MRIERNGKKNEREEERREKSGWRVEKRTDGDREPTWMLRKKGGFGEGGSEGIIR